jgi:hypothetical protein
MGLRQRGARGQMNSKINLRKAVVRRAARQAWQMPGRGSRPTAGPLTRGPRCWSRGCWSTWGIGVRGRHECGRVQKRRADSQLTQALPPLPTPKAAAVKSCRPLPSALTCSGCRGGWSRSGRGRWCRGWRCRRWGTCCSHSGSGSGSRQCSSWCTSGTSHSWPCTLGGEMTEGSGSRAAAGSGVGWMLGRAGGGGLQLPSVRAWCKRDGCPSQAGRCSSAQAADGHLPHSLL